MNYFKHSNLKSCMFMPPKEGEISLDKSQKSKNLNHSIPAQGRKGRNEIGEKLQKYKMKSPFICTNPNNCQTENRKGDGYEEIPLPYIHIKRKLGKGTVIFLHANADDIFQCEAQAKILSLELNVIFNFFLLSKKKN